MTLSNHKQVKSLTCSSQTKLRCAQQQYFFFLFPMFLWKACLLVISRFCQDKRFLCFQSLSSIFKVIYFYFIEMSSSHFSQPILSPHFPHVFLPQVPHILAVFVVLESTCTSQDNLLKSASWQMPFCCNLLSIIGQTHTWQE